MTRGYQSHARGGSFKNYNIGDAGLGELRRFNQQKRDSIERQKRTTRKYDDQIISKMNSNSSLEIASMERAKDIEDQAYKFKIKNLEKQGEAEVDKMLDEAKASFENANIWNQYSQTLAKTFGDAGVALIDDLAKKEYERQFIATMRDGAAPSNQLLNQSRKVQVNETIENKVTDVHDKGDRELTAQPGGMAAAQQSQQNSSKFSNATQAAHAYMSIPHIPEHLRDVIDRMLQEGKILTADNIKTEFDLRRRQIAQMNGWTNSSLRAVHEWNVKWATAVNSTVKRISDEHLQEKSKRMASVLQTKLKNEPTIQNFNYLQQHYAYFTPSESPAGKNRSWAREGRYTDSVVKAFDAILSKPGVPWDTINSLLEGLTPKDGRQPGNKATWEGRIPELRSIIRDKYLEQQDKHKRRVKDENTAKDLVDYESTKDWVKNEDGKGWNGDTKVLQQMIRDMSAKHGQNSITAGNLKSILIYAERRDVQKVKGVADKLFQDKNFKDLKLLLDSNVASQEVLKGLRDTYLPGISALDQQFPNIDITEKVEKDIRTKLQGGLKQFNVAPGISIETLGDTAILAEDRWWEIYNGYTDPNSKSPLSPKQAYEQAWRDFNDEYTKGRSEENSPWHITDSAESNLNGGQSYYTNQLYSNTGKLNTFNNEITDKSDLRLKIRTKPNLSQTTQILTDDVIGQIFTDISTGKSITIPEEAHVWSRETGRPPSEFVGHQLYLSTGNKQLLKAIKPGPFEILRSGIPETQNGWKVLVDAGKMSLPEYQRLDAARRATLANNGIPKSLVSPEIVVPNTNTPEVEQYRALLTDTIMPFIGDPKLVEGLTTVFTTTPGLSVNDIQSIRVSKSSPYHGGISISSGPLRDALKGNPNFYYVPALKLFSEGKKMKWNHADVDSGVFMRK